MPTATYKDVSNLVINRLTKAQYDALTTAGSIQSDQLYMITDESYYTVAELDANYQKILSASNQLPAAYISGLSAYIPATYAWSAITGTPTTLSGYGITDTYTKTEIDSKLASAYVYKGSVADYASLPSTGLTAGDVYNVTAAYGDYPAGTNWAWTGSAWDALGGTVVAETVTRVAMTLTGCAGTAYAEYDKNAKVGKVFGSITIDSAATAVSMTYNHADVGAMKPLQDCAFMGKISDTEFIPMKVTLGDTADTVNLYGWKKSDHVSFNIAFAAEAAA